VFYLPYELHLFMVEVYRFEDDSYHAICNVIDTLYELNWWKTIGTDLQGR
jgi:hypothetical protein